METMTLVVAGIAALAILLIAVGVASSGSSGISERLERYASGKDADAKAAQGQGGIQEILASSAALNQLNKVVEQRDFGANLARDIARADLRLKVSEFLAIWAASIVGVPLLMVVFSVGFPALRNPLFLIIGLNRLPEAHHGQPLMLKQLGNVALVLCCLVVTVVLGLVEPAITRDPSGPVLSLGHGQAHVIIALSEHSLRALALVILTNVGDGAC